MSRVPRIRFKGFEEDWEQRKLGEVAIFSKGVGYSKSDLKDSGIPIILYGRLYTNYEIVIKDVDTFADGICGAVYSKGGEIITPSSGETSEDISIASVVKKSGFLLGGDLNIIYPQSFLNPIFIAISISNGKPHKEMAKRAQGKSVVHLHNVDLSKIEIDYPSIDEQTRISSYFISLDHLITLHQRKLEKLKIIKKSMLENLFPQNGEKTPKIRFSGFTEDWEQRKLGECFTERIDSMPNGELISVTINDGIKKFSELGRHDNSNEDKSKYKKVCIGDIAYNSMRMWQGASGYSPYNGIVSPAYTVLVANEDVNSKCIAYQFKLPRMIHAFQINSQGITSDNWNLKFPTLSDISIYISRSIDEQGKIASLLESLDHLITLHQSKLDKLQKIKKSMLESMFV